GAVVNLAGEGIADRRWTPARKAALVESRIRATTSLVRAVREATAPPGVFVSASGVGYYGPTGDEPVDESAPPGSDFLAQLAVQWEHAAAPAGTACRVVLLRTGMVLGHGGALKRMLLPFRLGVGGRLGSGRQWMPWIHVDDWVALVERLMADERGSGPFNLAAPAPVRNRDFTRALGRALSRPAILPVPAFALSLALGELAQVLITGQRAVPHRAEQLGFSFAYGTIDVALAATLR
ncbi:MAG: TIGR01777 family oxidoreductase, partial [Vicinamibacterales bacterium]